MIVGALIGAAATAPAMDDSQVVKDRAAVMKQQAKDLGVVKAHFTGKGDPAAAATATADLTHTTRKIPDLFPPGSDAAGPDGKFAPKPEIWSQWDKFLAAQKNAAAKADALDLKAFLDGLPAVSQTNRASRLAVFAALRGAVAVLATPFPGRFASIQREMLRGIAAPILSPRSAAAATATRRATGWACRMPIAPSPVPPQQVRRLHPTSLRTRRPGSVGGAPPTS
jgi:cytochrome c556